MPRSRCMPGEVMALVGQNGAGKSTMIKVLNGFVARDAGDITLLGPALGRHLAPDGAAGRHQHHLPGNQPHPAPLGDREHLSRPRAAQPRRPAGLAADGRGRAGAAQGVRRRGRRPPAARPLQHGRPADGGDRPGRLVRGEARHHGRGHVLARRARGPGAVPDHPPAEAARACRWSSSATSSTSSTRSATASP